MSVGGLAEKLDESVFKHTSTSLGDLAAHRVAADLQSVLADVWDEGHAAGYWRKNPYRPEATP
ncbi:hypothetical protein [Agrococcus sp. DT81.2]|uniref:hypothetical protein n=1 Tax=Agrococcus sp. DT81.2 TaxID=3393414 RepID=UPI003CE574C1